MMLIYCAFVFFIPFLRLKQSLIPCLACLCLNNDINLSAMRKHLSPLLIGSYFKRMCQFIEDKQVDSRGNYDKSSRGKGQSTQDAMTALLDDLSSRVPKTQWLSIVFYFK